MSRSSEAVLLRVDNVRHKKNDGTLFIMGERIAWMTKGRSDKFSLDVSYTAVATQKISPEGKAKVQLQLVMHDGATATLHFNDPQGHDKQLRDRDQVKEILQTMLPKFKQKVNKELETRHKILSSNPGLLQLYKDLVITSILTPEAFWEQHGSQFGLNDGSKKKEDKSTDNNKRSNVRKEVNMYNNNNHKQAVGVSGAFLSEIKPQADGANGLRYNLTADIMESIFKTYPAVRAKHLEYVPSRMSEQQFWTKFFQSHYYHRDRIHQGGVKDLFVECAKDDEKQMRAQLKAGVKEPLANVGGFSDQTLDENFGVKTSQDESGAALNPTQVSNNIVHQNLIKRFNQHSIMVMRSADDSTNDHHSKKASKVTKEVSSTSSNNLDNGNNESRKRLVEKLEYEDLEEGQRRKIAKLNLANVDRYLSGPVEKHVHSSYPSHSLTGEQIVQFKKDLSRSLHTWCESNSLECLSSTQAVGALVDLSPGGALMKAARIDALAEQCPEAIRVEMRQLYTSLNELMRHFWACFPPTTPALQDKATKMHDTIKKFQMVKLKSFENEVARTYSNLSATRLTSHLNQMLEAAVRKFELWRNKTRPNTK